MKTVISEIQNAQIPLDVTYADIDYMDRYQDFTIGEGWEQLPKYIEQIHSENMHIVLIFDPAVQVDGQPFARGLHSVCYLHLFLINQCLLL
uniref:Glyco_hydro_114 domain-containing protein n=1 Tax=Ascaris lumbricoides TaxID=6252 RepID=A0A0M3HM53_ASCLU